ncbi:MAG TPA: hypothetical protein VIQ51_01490 [Chryseosolibacter sp.]
MTTTNQKQEIVQSLRHLDAVQSEKVLNFIKGLLDVEHNDLHHQHLKVKALKEISHALQAQHSF